MTAELSGALFGALTPGQQGEVLSAGRSRRYADGDLIARRGDLDTVISVIERGQVRVSRVSRDGRESVTATLRAGDSFGEFAVFARVPRQFDFNAVGDVELRDVEREDLRRLMSDDPALRDQLLETLARKLMAATEALDDLRQLPLVLRAAKWLLQSIAGESPAVWRGTQSELADTLGVTRVAVGQALHRLREWGLVQTAYRRIEIPSVEQLQQWFEQNNPR